MRILIVDHGKIPAFKYGGTERVIWDLGKALVQKGHEVHYLVAQGSVCDFAKVWILNNELPILAQIPAGFDLVHFQFQPESEPEFPYLVTNHGNRNDFNPFLPNTVFVSRNHANRYGSKAFVYNGLNCDDYQMGPLTTTPEHFHFLGNAAWRVKNVRGAIDIIRSKPKEKLAVMGGKRFNFKMGVRFTFNPRIQFYGMVGGNVKLRIISNSKGLLFPVLWHEPFGLAIIESLFMGKPVFGTPYGSLPELVNPEVGALSNNANELSEKLDQWKSYNPTKLREYACSLFNASEMCNQYEKYYEMVLNGLAINEKQPVLLEQSPRFLPWVSL